MLEIGFIIVGVVVVVNAAFTLWSYTSLRRLVGGATTRKLEDKFFVEHVIHTRASLNLIYASMATITFFLAFFGFKVVRDITEAAKEDIIKENRASLAEFEKTTGELTAKFSNAKKDVEALSGLLSHARHIVGIIEAETDTGRALPLRYFVVQGLDTGRKKKYTYEELSTISGGRIIYVTKKPVVFWQSEVPNRVPPNARLLVTKDGIGVDSFGGVPINLLICVMD